MSVLDELRPGLWRWTAPHPDWTRAAQPGSSSDWPQRVGCVACACADAFVVVDPLVPGDREAEFWDEVDALIARHGQRVAVLTTISFHRRSRAEFVARHGAATSRAKDALPAGVETVPIRRAGEVMVWLAEHRALVPGDRLLGDGDGGLRTCPDSWLGYLETGMDGEGLREALRPLLELPVEMVLASHGEPVLAGGRGAIERALAAPA